MLALLQSSLAVDSRAAPAAPMGGRNPRVCEKLSWRVAAMKRKRQSQLTHTDGRKISGPSFLAFAVTRFGKLDSPEGSERGKVCHERHVGTSLPAGLICSIRSAQCMTIWSAWRHVTRGESG